MSELFATFGINGKLLVVQLVNFGILLAALTYLLYKPLMTLMEERAALIGKGVKDAEAAQKKLAAAEAESRTIVGGAASEAERIIGNARAHALERGVAIEAAAKDRAESIVKEAAQRGESITAEALRESKSAVAKAAVLAAEKILKGEK
jgi:F-type H+-transporting ATPase subunit b